MIDPEPGDESLVFVYGTLRQEARGRVQSELTQGWTFIGYGTVVAELYHLGAYPGAVPSAAGPRVRGELYRMIASRATLEALDDHEGEEFTRSRVEVTLESGSIETAWIYWHCGDPNGTRISSGDWLARGADSS